MGQVPPMDVGDWQGMAAMAIKRTWLDMDADDRSLLGATGNLGMKYVNAQHPELEHLFKIVEFQINSIKVYGIPLVGVFGRVTAATGLALISDWIAVVDPKEKIVVGGHEWPSD